MSTIDFRQHEVYMQQALLEAQKALAQGETPIGAVIVRNGEIIARAHNLRETAQDATAHAEILAIRQAGQKLGGWRLPQCALYVTVEPCPMCAGALVQSRMELLVYGARDAKAGAVHSVYNIVQDARLNHQLAVIDGICEQECASLLRSFFRARREQNKQIPKGAVSKWS